ncbi:MAG: hypothetical protein JNJ78_11350 [Anaerolineae bacterium]|nr:hypothetical protein [Anaerolineae bacterium]
MISTSQITMPVAVTPVAALDRNALCLRQSRPFPPRFLSAATTTTTTTTNAPSAEISAASRRL